MKFISLFVTSLLPFGLMAAPVADGGENDGSQIGDGPELAPGSTTPARDVGDDIFKRSTQTCTIIGGSASVNCRAGPGTQYKVNAQVYRGSNYIFSCVATGECVTIGGSTNCGWDKTGGCYVNGHYTDNRCTLASLGYC